MSTLSRVLTGAGVVLGVVGLLGVVAPDAIAGLPAGETALALVGVAILLQGLRVVNYRRREPPEELETPDTELQLELPTPGDDIDADLRYLAEERRYDRERRRRIRNRLHAAAVEAVARRRGCSTEEAERIVDGGEWTDDRRAAAFFATVRDEGSLTDELRYLVRSESLFHRRANRAAAEVHRIATGGDL